MVTWRDRKIEGDIIERLRVLLQDVTSNQEHLRDVAGFSDSSIVKAKRLNAFHDLDRQETVFRRTRNDTVTFIKQTFTRTRSPETFPLSISVIQSRMFL